MFRVVSASWMRDKNHAEKLPKVIHKCVQERERERECFMDGRVDGR